MKDFENESGPVLRLEATTIEPLPTPTAAATSEKRDCLELTTSAAVAVSDLCQCRLASTSSSSTSLTTKQVRFHHPEPTVVNVFEDSDDFRERWITKKEINKTRRVVAQQGRTWQRKGCKAHAALLQDIFYSPCSRRLEKYVSLPEEDFVRGLENYVCKDLARDRMKAKKQAIESVLQQQQSLKLKGQETQEEIALKLSVVSQEQTCHAVGFARQLGLADAFAVRLDDASFSLEKKTLARNWGAHQSPGRYRTAFQLALSTQTTQEASC